LNRLWFGARRKKKQLVAEEREGCAGDGALLPRGLARNVAELERDIQEGMETEIVLGVNGGREWDAGTFDLKFFDLMHF
jgi:hypothetical protein